MPPMKLALLIVMQNGGFHGRNKAADPTSRKTSSPSLTRVGASISFESFPFPSKQALMELGLSLTWPSRQPRESRVETTTA
ncbi:hypothetical protein EAF00_001721 [Botryotinia globosa]|nr:hypothetical protein EAF00_001721 [Botryotinia globosa]